MNTYLIQSVVRTMAGTVVTLSVTEDTATTEKEFLIASDICRDMHLLAGNFLTEEEFSTLTRCALLSQARARTKEILSYSGHSRKSLLAKLRHHNVPEDIASEAADWARDTGLIREEEQAMLAAETYHRRKYWGQKRIIAELIAKGYPSEIASAAAASVPEREYARALSSLLQKKYTSIPKEPAERQKIVLSLLRLGYTGQQIKDALTAFSQAE